MNEQELFNTINALIDEGVQAGCPADRRGRAGRMPGTEAEGHRQVRDRRCGQAFEPEAVTDLTAQILSARCEPWKWPPGVRPRLKGWKDGISRLIPKPSVMELLEAGDARAGCGWRTRSGPPTALQAKVESYAAWLRESADDLRREMERLEGRIDGQTAMAGELERVMAIVKPVMDEDPSLTIGEALKVMAARGLSMM